MMKSTRIPGSWRGPESLALALLVLGAAGCALFAPNVPITPETGQPIPAGRIYRPEFTRPSPGNTAKVWFLRDAGNAGRLCTHDVLVDQGKIFAIRAGEFQALYLAPGQHMLVVETGGFGNCPAFSKSHLTVLRDGAEEIHRIFITPFKDGFGVQQLISTSASNSFSTTHYDWVVPPAAGWKVSEWETPFQLKHSISPNTQFRIVVLETAVLSDRLRGQTARFVADDYRQEELDTMIQSGDVVTDVERGEVSAGGKTFWTMRYRLQQSVVTEHATLYVYLPQATGNEHFLVILSIADTPRNAVPGSQHEGELMRLLESVKAR
jgi:hypothetical protein